MWTHGFNLIVKAVCILLVVALLLHFPALLDASTLLYFTVFIPCFALLYYGFFRQLGDYLYCRLILKMNVAWKETAQLKGALSPTLSLDWLPLKEVKQTPIEDRFNTALMHYTAWNTEKREKRRAQISRFQSMSGHNKIWNVLIFIFGAGAMATGLLDLPPATYITDFYCELFNTNEYYPMLNSLILLSPVLLLAFLLKKAGIEMM